VSVGRPIDVRDVLIRSAQIIRAQPLLLVPQLIVLVPTVLGDAAGGSVTLDLFRAVTEILSFVFFVIASGAYPPLVKTILEGGQVSVTDALAIAYRKFWTLLLASLAVILIVGLGLIALVVPGVILWTWYAYTVPSVMLEGNGVPAAMSSSKAFGRDKKVGTFLITLAAGLVILVILIVQAVFSLASPLVADIVYDLLLVPFGAWFSVVLAYTYIAYGPSPVATQTQATGFGPAPPPPATPQPAFGPPGN
jgi:hypothetical protein